MSRKDLLSNHKKVSSRCVALEILHHWQQDLKPIGPTIERFATALPEVDHHLVSNIVNGVLSNMEYLDIILANFSRHPVGKMKPWTLMAFRLGIYQLLFLERVPESAAVNETVKAFKSRRQPKWLVNFVNGVLRAVNRKKNSLPKPDVAGKNGGPVLNHPKWLLQRWEKRYGQEKARLICSVNNQKPPLSLRVNSLRIACNELEKMISQQGWSVRKGTYARDSLLLDSFSGPVTDLSGYHDGYFQVQDEAAQLAVYLLGPMQSGCRYLDACAGLGGKTTYMAQLLPEGAWLQAVEPEQFRAKMLGDNLRRLHLEDRVGIYHGSLKEYARDNDTKFHAVLVDAPCTGTGVIRRHPDMRWSRKKSDLGEKQKLQLKLLAEAASLLLPGGVLVYATCSLEPEENEQVVASFLKNHSDFTVAAAQDFLPENAGVLVDSAGYFCPTPAEGLDGFFAVRLLAPL